jgi:hypothetical protein
MENFTTVIRSIASDQNEFRRERLLKVLSAATFLIFFQAYMVAPLIPRLSIAFGISAQQIGLYCSGISDPLWSFDTGLWGALRPDWLPDHYIRLPRGFHHPDGPHGDC